MSASIKDSVRNSFLSDVIAEVGATAVLVLFSGAATGKTAGVYNADPTGQLVEVALPSSPFGAPSAGSAALANGPWTGTASAGSSTAPASYRIKTVTAGGVATVVSKLFLQVAPDFAMFGEKDYQQLKVVTRMAKDLDIPITVVGCRTLREKDGLALSSRNVYLSSEERSRAPFLHQVLQECSKAIREGRDPAATLEAGRASLTKAGFAVDYLEARNAESLAPLASPDERPIRLLIAARLGKTRLIDNIGV